MTMTHILAIGRKQNRDTLKNKTILIQFVIFPVMAFVMEYAVKIDGMPPNYFMNLFAVMFVGMAPMTAMSALLSEEKETNTLRMLKMAGITSLEYMLGAGGYLFGICLLGAVLFGFAGSLSGMEFLIFLAVMAIGIVISLLLGGVIGIWSKNQSAATSVTVPIMMIFSFLPMISMFNDTIRQVARFTYSWQIQQLLGEIAQRNVSVETVAVLAGNLLVAVVLFAVAYRKRGL